ncbi:MAG TPA: DUF6036 family nucleotidyltransferase [Solirubrobacterales bacterium]|nr:DUF6036 family nucleotidyltransferase [Solirubrobacterales bacterium]
MRKPDFDHIIAAAAALTGETEIVVIGSQAILGTVADPPASMLRSIEADIYPRARPEKAEEIDGALGDGSQFQATFGYYAHGVGPETAKAPAGWEDRLVRAEVPRRPGESGAIVALCLEANDLVLAKCAAGRDRDWDFAFEALRAEIVELPRLLDAVEEMPLDSLGRRQLRAMLEGIGTRLPAS